MPTAPRGPRPAADGPPGNVPAPGRDRLRAHLLATGIAGRVATARQRSLSAYHLFAARDPRVLTGLDPDGDWDAPAVLGLMARRCGVSPDPAAASGRDTIDPDLTLAALDALAARLARAAAARVPVLVATGHPGTLLGFHAALARALSAAGCPVLTPGRGRAVGPRSGPGAPTGTGARVLDYVRMVALVRSEGARERGGARPAHTHSPLPVRMLLEAAADAGGPLPGLVIADHGWACGAGQLGFETIAPADVNDPAPFVAEAEGRIALTVPLDDSVRSDYYRPLTRYVLNRACLSQ